MRSSVALLLMVSGLSGSGCSFIFTKGPQPEVEGAGYGFGAAIAGGIAAAVFIPSAVVGYNRTAACRASQEPTAREPASPARPDSSLLLAPPSGCPTPGDVPRLCTGQKRVDDDLSWASVTPPPP